MINHNPKSAKLLVKLCAIFCDLRYEIVITFLFFFALLPLSLSQSELKIMRGKTIHFHTATCALIFMRMPKKNSFFSVRRVAKWYPPQSVLWFNINSHNIFTHLRLSFRTSFVLSVFLTRTNHRNDINVNILIKHLKRHIPTWYCTLWAVQKCQKYARDGKKVNENENRKKSTPETARERRARECWRTKSASRSHFNSGKSINKQYVLFRWWRTCTCFFRFSRSLSLRCSSSHFVNSFYPCDYDCLRFSSHFIEENETQAIEQWINNQNKKYSTRSAEKES